MPSFTSRAISAFLPITVQVLLQNRWPGLQDTPRVTPGMMGRKLLQQMHGMNRGSSGAGQSSAGVPALPAEGTGPPPGPGRLQVPPPLSPRDRTAASPGDASAGIHEGILQATAASVAPGARKHQPRPDPEEGANPARYTQPAVTWVSPVPPQGDSAAPPASIF